MIFLFLRVLDGFSTSETFVERNLAAINATGDQEPASNGAFVSIYYGDTGDYNYLQSLLVLGFTLNTLTIKYDRVVVLNSKEEFPDQVINVLMKAWTHVIYRPAIDFDEDQEIPEDVKKKLFKLQIMTLTQYDTIVYMDADSIALSNMGNIQKWPIPSSSIDFYNFRFGDKGPMYSSVMMHLRPSHADYVGLLHTVKSTEKFDLFDQTVFMNYYGDRMTIMPITASHDNGGYDRTVFGNPQKITGPISVSSIHFGGKMKPWGETQSSYTQVWTLFASHCFEKLDVPFVIGKVVAGGDAVLKGFLTASSEIKRKLQQEENAENDEDDIYVYATYEKNYLRRNLSIIFQLFFTVSLAVAGLLTVINKEKKDYAPLDSSSDRRLPAE